MSSSMLKSCGVSAGAASKAARPSSSVALPKQQERRGSVVPQAVKEVFMPALSSTMTGALAWSSWCCSPLDA